MPVAVVYDVDGVEQTTHDLLAMGARAMEPRPILLSFIDVMRSIEADVFATEGRGTWAPLADATVARKGNDTIGRETDAMMESLTGAGTGHVAEVIGDELIFGTELTSEDGAYYPGFFDSGTSRQPSRPLFMIDEHDLRGFSKAVHAWLMGAERAEFGAGDWALAAL